MVGNKAIAEPGQRFKIREPISAPARRNQITTVRKLASYFLIVKTIIKVQLGKYPIYFYNTVS